MFGTLVIFIELCMTEELNFAGRCQSMFLKLDFTGCFICDLLEIDLNSCMTHDLISQGQQSCRASYVTTSYITIVPSLLVVKRVALTLSRFSCFGVLLVFSG